MHILFSMPVHENNDIIRMGLENLRKYVNNYTVVMHVSESFKDFDATIADMPNVIVNPTRKATKHGNSQFGLHLDNFKLAAESNIPFTTFCVYHTSEMFVKHGVEDLIAKHEYSIWYNSKTMPRNIQWHPMQYALHNKVFDDLLPDRTWYIGSLIEGMWISRRIMECIYQWALTKLVLMTMLPGWTFEEVAFPTLAHWFGRNLSYGEPYNAFFDKPLEISDVDKVLQGQPVELWATNAWNKSQIPILSNGSTKFSVKRFNRNTDDPVRSYVLTL